MNGFLEPVMNGFLEPVMNGFPGRHEWVFMPHEWDFGELRNTAPPWP
jgi:hypothetical protein